MSGACASVKAVHCIHRSAHSTLQPCTWRGGRKSDACIMSGAREFPPHASNQATATASPPPPPSPTALSTSAADGFWIRRFCARELPGRAGVRSHLKEAAFVEMARRAVNLGATFTAAACMVPETRCDDDHCAGRRAGGLRRRQRPPAPHAGRRSAPTAWRRRRRETRGRRSSTRAHQQRGRRRRRRRPQAVRLQRGGWRHARATCAGS